MAEFKKNNGIMGDAGSEDEKSSGGGNRNAIAYGLLQGAGVNTNGLTPTQAWELVSEMNLMENREWKRTDEDKKEIKDKNYKLKASGANKEQIKQKALMYANTVHFGLVGNTAALNEAVDSIAEVIDEYQVNKLDFARAKNLSRGTLASANDSGVNIGTRLLRNPNAAYRICVENYKQNLENIIKSYEDEISIAIDGFRKDALIQRVEELKKQRKFSRHNVIYKGEEVKSVTLHEMGHVLAGQIFGFIKTTGALKGTNKIINDTYNQSLNNGDIHKISAYAASSPDEFFAECFTMYKMGKEKLPNKIHNMMEGVLRQWKR